jgi:hypothetical protein
MWSKDDLDTYILNQLRQKTKSARENNRVQSLYDQYGAKNNTDDKLIKMVVFTDLHLDFKYTPGNSN